MSTDLAQHSATDRAAVAAPLNGRRRKMLGWPPVERLASHLRLQPRVAMIFGDRPVGGLEYSLGSGGCMRASIVRSLPWLTSAAVFGVNVVLNRVDGTALWGTAVVGLAITLFSVWYPRKAWYAVVVAPVALAEGAVRARVATVRQLGPVAHKLIKLIAHRGSGRPQVRDSVKQLILNAIAAELADPDTRVCLFEPAEGSPCRRLRAKATAVGRSDQPRTVFSEQDPNHREVFDLVDRYDNKYYSDLAKHAPPGLRADTRYVSYVAQGISNDGRTIGLLTCDSPNRNAYTQTDIDMIEVYSRLLAIVELS